MISLFTALVAASTAAADPTPQSAPQQPAETVERTMISRSTPADGAMLQGSPATFEVTFAHPMKLKSVAISDSEGQSVPVSSAPETLSAASARVALPKLVPGTYRLSWVGEGGSGREMRGSLSFMVH